MRPLDSAHTAGPTPTRGAPLLVVEGVRVPMPGRRRAGRSAFLAVDGVSFTVTRGETVAIVGESGCGKSTLANAIVRLLEPSEGSIVLDGVDWTHLSRAALRRRRASVQMVFQDPYGSLDPRMTVGAAIEEPLSIYESSRRTERRRRVLELLELVGLPPETAGRRPRELSGGQRQRVAIARAVACQSPLVICDEPTAALDASIQAQVLNLLLDLQARLKVAYIFITHDLAVVRHLAHRVCVMYMGRFVEEGSAEEITSRPLHPYTIMLLDSVLTLDPDQRESARTVVVGEPGDPSHPASGCRFHPRCAYATGRCRSIAPALEEVAPGRSVACHEWRRVVERYV
jgi:oligopeptide transport system ATP-binding protein